MRKHLLFLYTALLLLSASFRAQSTFTFSSQTVYGLNNPVPDGTTVSDTVMLRNNGPDSSAYKGNITFLVYVRDSVQNTAFLLDSATFIVDSIPRNSSMSFGLQQTFLTNHISPNGRCKIGNNVVVIWPISNDIHFKCLDTIKTTVYIIASDASKLDVSDILNIFPNPSSTHISIAHYGDFSSPFLDVTVYDASGRKVAGYGTEHIIDVSELSKGIYLVEVTFPGGGRAVRKIWKE